MASEILFDVNQWIKENPPVQEQKRGIKKPTFKDILDPYKDVIVTLFKYNKDENGKATGATYTNRMIMKVLAEKCEVVFEVAQRDITRDGKKIQVPNEIGFKRLTKYLGDLKKELYNK